MRLYCVSLGQLIVFFGVYALAIIIPIVTLVLVVRYLRKK